MSGSEQRILLLVHRHPEIRAMVREILADAGFLVVEVADEAEAPQRYRELRPLAVLLELCREGTAGGGLLALLSGDGNRTPLVVMSAAVAPPEVLEYARHGVMETLRTPFESGDLLAVVYSVISRHLRLLETEHRAALEANRLKSQFLSYMSHEVRIPMNGVLNFARFGLRSVEKVARRDEGGAMVGLREGGEWLQELEFVGHAFQRIVDNGERLLRILNDILDLSKIQADRLEFLCRSHHADVLAETALGNLASQASAKEIALHFTGDPEVTLHCDFGRLVQVLQNLVSNAIKFSPPDSRVELRLRGDPERVRFEVADSGVGIPEDQLEAIFDPFTQSRLTDDGSGGTGLGLTISRKIAEAHGGRLWAENQAGGGSRFFLELPAGGCTCAAGACATAECRP